ncbi:MAG: 30S ribosomal protein S9 [Patescibacteria group bacterium]|nr:30S ribosomal protein S9 [Patescibacteria group bacterium]
MAAKKISKKEKIEKEAKTGAGSKKKYYSGVGRRKTSVARVRLFEESKEASSVENITVNGKKLEDYFPLAELQDMIAAPLKAAGEKSNFSVSVKAAGGGIRGQAEAIRLGIARSIVEYDESLRKSLRDAGYLTRDSRIVERKKAGLKKARRAPQWQKR